MRARDSGHAGERAKYPFWVHQVVEYVLGFFLFLTAIRLIGASMVHALACGLLFVGLAAVSKGPLAAFRWLGRKAHRAADLVLIVFLAASPLLLRMDNVGMIILFEALALAQAVLVRRTAYVDPPKPVKQPRNRDQVIDTVTRAATGGARVAGEFLGKAGREGPRRLGKFVGKHKRRPS